MRFVLRDDEVDPARLLTEPRYEHTIADVVGADDGGTAAVLRDFVEGLQSSLVSDLVAATTVGVGYGHELAGSMYDDDLDEGDEPFEGVLISAQFRDDEVVMSRAAYERLVAALVERVAAKPRP